MTREQTAHGGASALVDRRAEQLRAPTRASTAINATATVEERLREISEQARQVVRAHHAITTLRPSEAGRPVIDAVSLSDEYDDRRRDTVHPAFIDLASSASDANRPLRLSEEEL